MPPSGSKPEKGIAMSSNPQKLDLRALSNSQLLAQLPKVDTQPFDPLGVIDDVEAHLAQKYPYELPKEGEGVQLPGSIPLSWFAAAATVDPRAAALGLAIWTQVQLTGKATVTLSPSLLYTFGFNRQWGTRTLKDMAGAGLVKILSEATHTVALRIKPDDLQPPAGERIVAVDGGGQGAEPSREPAGAESAGSA